MRSRPSRSQLLVKAGGYEREWLGLRFSSPMRLIRPDGVYCYVQETGGAGEL